MKNSDEILLVKIDGCLIKRFIENANERVLIAKPSLFSAEVKTLKTVLQKKQCRCQIIIEEGDMAVRLGFGETAAISECLELKNIVELRTTDSIRLSMILVDDQAIFFAPTALSWEEEKRAEDLQYPNGVLLAGEWVNHIFNFYSYCDKDKEPHIKMHKNVVPFPTTKIANLKSETESFAKIEETIEILQKNKPVNPTQLRKTAMYRNLFKLLKIEVVGANVRTKSISLRPFNKFFKNRDERLKSSWQVFTPTEVKSLSALTEIYSRIEDMKEDFNIRQLGRFGNLMDLSKKDEFEKKIKFLIKEFKGVAETHIDKKPDLALKLEINLRNSRKALADYLFSLLINDESALFAFKQNNPEIFRSLCLLKPDLKNNLEEELKNGLEVYIETKLKFPNEKSILEAIDIKLDYYDISDELLNENPDFQNLLDNRIPNQEFRKYTQGYTTG